MDSCPRHDNIASCCPDWCKEEREAMHTPPPRVKPPAGYNPPFLVKPYPGKTLRRFDVHVTLPVGSLECDHVVLNLTISPE